MVMTPTEVIDQIVLSYGQLAGKRETIFTWTKEVLREVEEKLAPAYTKTSTTRNISGSTTMNVSGAITIDQVYHNTNDVLFRLTKEHMARLTSVSDGFCLYWAQELAPGHVKITFNEAPTDPVVVEYYAYTDLGGDPDVDSEALDHVFPIVLKGLHAKAALVLKDTQRATEMRVEYLNMLGELPQTGGRK